MMKFSFQKHDAKRARQVPDKGSSFLTDVGDNKTVSPFYKTVKIAKIICFVVSIHGSFGFAHN
jgi:hypothetical protein